MAGTFPFFVFLFTTAAVSRGAFVAMQLRGKSLVFGPRLVVLFGHPKIDLKLLIFIALRGFPSWLNCTTKEVRFRPRNRLGNTWVWRELKARARVNFGRVASLSQRPFTPGLKASFSISSSTSSSLPPIKVNDTTDPLCSMTSDDWYIVSFPTSLAKSPRTSFLDPTGNS